MHLYKCTINCTFIQGFVNKLKADRCVPVRFGLMLFCSHCFRFFFHFLTQIRAYFQHCGVFVDTHDNVRFSVFREFQGHHYSTTCYQHCINVSYYNYLVCRKLGLNSRSAARAGLLHDLFLYDWRDREKKKGEMPHGMTHPKVALNNAKQHFEIGKREEDMIVKHMWPLTLKFPKYAESYVIRMIWRYRESAGNRS